MCGIDWVSEGKTAVPLLSGPIAKCTHRRKGTWLFIHWDELNFETSNGNTSPKFIARDVLKC